MRALLPASRFLVLAAIALAIGLGGCISSSPDREHLDEVDALVRDRTRTPFSSESLLAQDAVSAPSVPSGTALTVEKAVARALQQNLSLIASAENLAIAQAQLAQAGLIQNPVYNFTLRPLYGGGLADFEQQIVKTLADVITEPWRVDLAELQRYQSGVALASQAFSTAQAVEQQWRQLTHLVRSRAIAADDAGLYGRAFQAAEARAKVGVIFESDLNRARLQLLDAQRQMRSLDIQIDQAARQLNWLMGDAGPPEWRLPGDASRPPATITDLPPASALEPLAVRYRLDLAQAKAQEKLAEVSVTLAQLGVIPNVTIGGDIEKTDPKDSKNKRGFTGSVEIPVFDPGWVGVVGAKAAVRLAAKTARALEGQVQQDVRFAYEDLRAARFSVELYRDQLVPGQVENARLAQLAFDLGKLDLDSLLNTLHDTAGARQAYEASIAGYDAAVIEVEGAVGLTWARLLEESARSRVSK